MFAMHAVPLDIVHGLQAHGGARQRAERAQRLQRNVPRSKLAECLLFLFGWGLLSANAVQWLASAALADGLDHEDIKRLAQIGASGTFSGNARRDLLSKFSHKIRVGMPTSLWVPMKDKLDRVEEAIQLVISPTVLVNSIWTHFRSLFPRMFGANPRAFWEKVDPQDPKLIALKREMGECVGWEDRTIPYIIWGDGGRFTHKNENSMNVITMKSLLADANFESAIVPLWGLPKSAAVKSRVKEEDTFWILWEQTVHSLNQLFEGVGAERDSSMNRWRLDSRESTLAGQQLCGGYRFVCWCLAADLDYMGNDLGFPHHGSLYPCVFDSASREQGTDYPITDLSRNAGWKSTLIEPEEGICVPHRPPSQ